MMRMNQSALLAPFQRKESHLSMCRLEEGLGDPSRGSPTALASGFGRPSEAWRTSRFGNGGLQRVGVDGVLVVSVRNTRHDRWVPNGGK